MESLIAESCAGCHGVDGNSVVDAFPKLAGQQKVYLLRDLTAIAAYYADQTPTPGVVTRSELLPLGKRVYLEGNTKSGVPSCDGCHEENGEGSKKFPRVAGQHAAYALDQVAQYASGKRSNGVKVMRTIAERLTKEEAEAVAEYMTSLK